MPCIPFLFEYPAHGDPETPATTSRGAFELLKAAPRFKLQYIARQTERSVSEFVLDDFLPYQLAVAAQRVSREYAAIYRDRFGISVAEWRVIAHLSRSGTVSVREIHDRVDMDKSRVSRAAARLETRGLVSKRPSPGDRRLVELALTASGRELIAEIAPLAHDFERRVMARLGQDGAAFRAGLETLMDREMEKAI